MFASRCMIFLQRATNHTLILQQENNDMFSSCNLHKVLSVPTQKEAFIFQNRKMPYPK